ncbi:Calx-beta domain-containing protein [Maribacter sp. Asnod1-A12]|uniref:Calx-beta domain-containing protein n=1 Tax=Maribacter sp. Asnod1-A12 TaxID=3160576 RepID=UPI00386465D8
MFKILLKISFFLCCVSLSAQIDLSLTQSASICSSDGSISATASGGSEPYQYRIISGPQLRPYQSSGNFLALQPGTFTVEVRDATFTTISDNITVNGDYTLPNLSVTITPPTCSSNADGQVVLNGSDGNFIGTTEFPEYKYRIVDLSTTPQTVIQEQNTDTFTGLAEGTYTFQIEDGCQNTVSETVTLTAPTITTLDGQIDFVEKAACDTYEVEYDPFGRGVSPHDVTVTEDATGTIIFSGSVDSSFGSSYSLGSNYNFGSSYTANIVDACGQAETKPFSFTPDLDMWSQKAYDCSGETAFFVFASLTNSSLQEPSILVPATLTLTNQTDASDVLIYTFTDPDDLEADIREADIQLGDTYNAVLEDSCSYTINTSLTFTPVPATTFEVNVRPERGCMDGTTGVGFHVRNGGTNYGKVTILSGPASFTSESGVVTNYSYPREFVNPNGSSVYPEAFPPGVYEAEITDGCESGIETFEILASQTVEHDFSLDFLQGCGNSNSLIINPNIISNINSTFYTNVNITNLDTGNSVFRESIYFFTEGTPVAVPNLPSGNYQLNLEFQSGGECVSNNAFTCPCEPQTRNITIPGYVSTSFDNIVGYLCTEGSGVIFAEGSNGIAPYQYEIIDSSVPSNIGRTSTDGIFTATDEGTYTVRITDSCGNSADGAFEVVPYLPNLVANCEASGTRVTLTANPVTDAIFTWIDDSGTTIQQGTSNELVFDPFDASQGGEYILQVEAPGLNCTIFDGTITIPNIPCDSSIDISKTVETGPIYNSITDEYTVTYRITAENKGGLSGSYDVIDTFILGDGFSLVNATLAYGNETDGVDGSILTPFISGDQIITSESLAGLRTESWLVTAIFTLDKDLYDPTQNCTNGGGLGNQITATGDTDTTNNTACVPVEIGRLEITKDGAYVDTDSNGLTNIGDEVNYTFIVSNTGNVAISNVIVTDALLGGVISGPIAGDTDSDGELDTTETWSFSANYDITQTNIDDNQVNNLASVTGEDPDTNSITETSTDPSPCSTCTPDPSCADCTLTELPSNPSFTINDSSTVEGTNNIFTITATSSISQDITFNLAYTNISTTSTDYSGPSTITLLANTTSVSFNVAAVDDNFIEPNETFEVKISNALSSEINITDDIGLGEIIDNDGGVGTGISFENDNITVDESAGTATVNVLLTGSVQGGFTLDFTSTDNSAFAPGDYTTTSGQLTFTGTDGETLPITIPIIDDNIIEALENLTVDLSNLSTPLISINDNQATVNITDNDGGAGTGISFENDNITVNEAAGTATVNVLLTGNVQGGFTLDFTTTDNSAIAPGDYTTSTGQLTFAGTDGETQPITIPIIDDNTIEALENLTVNLSNLSTSLISINDNQATVNITDNDSNPSIYGVQFDTTSVEVNEDAGTVTLDVVLNADVQDEFTVEFYTVDGSANDSKDYTGVSRNSQTLTFGGTNSNTQTIVIPIIDDIVIEAPETFNVILENISSPIVGILSDNTATVTIIDNDGDEGWPTDETIEACDAIPDAFVITSDSSCAITVDYNELVEGQDDECATEYTITRTWTITDCVGNSRTHTQVITIEDTVAPTFNEALPEDVTVECNMVPEAETLTATDSCEPNIVVTFEETITNDENCTTGYTVTRTWTATDCADNETEHTQVITIEPSEPIMSQPYEEEITIICGDEIPEAPEMVFTGGCDNFQVVFNEEIQQTEGSDDYLIIRTWNVTDSCSNTASFEQIIFVLQQQLQEITINICIEEEPIDLLNYLPADFDRNGTFMVLEGDVVLEENYFDPMNHQPGEYKIAYSSTEGTCKYYVDFTVIVDTECVPCNRDDIEISRAVTANGDGVNDIFEIKGAENCEFSFDVVIFNRWGVKIFEAKDYQNDWGGESPDGSFGQSGRLPTGTYYYIVDATDKNTDTTLEPFSGYIYLATE